MSVAIDEQCVAGSGGDFGATRKRVQHPGKELRRHGIVSGCDVNKFAGGEIDPVIDRGVKAFARNLMKLKTRVALSDGLEKFPGAIVGVAIENDCLPIGEGLIEQRFDSRFEKFPRVERREQNRNLR